MSVWYVASTEVVGPRRLARKVERCGAEVVASGWRASITMSVSVERGDQYLLAAVDYEALGTAMAYWY
jgi:hypothetical protein